MLFQDIARVNFALPLGAYESRVGKNDSANGGTKLARSDSRSHASHGMSQNDRLNKSEPFNQSNDIVGEVGVQISMRRCARFSVTPRVRHHNVVVTFKSAYYRSPASPTSDQAMKRNERGLVASSSQIMDADSVCFAGSAYPVCHTAVARARKGLRLGGPRTCSLADSERRSRTGR